MMSACLRGHYLTLQANNRRRCVVIGKYLSTWPRVCVAVLCVPCHVSACIAVRGMAACLHGCGSTCLG